jgi:hypothetical protein
MKLIFTIVILISALYGQKIKFNNNFQNVSTWKLDKKINQISMIKNNGAYFNLYYNLKRNFKNGKLSVYFKANSGYMDQGGGLMWRVQDKNNYYIARFNPLEDNFTYYKVINGRRITLKSSHITLSNNWHKMTIIQKKNHFEGYLDDKKLLEYNDNSIKYSGGIGLWTKSDAKTSFKNLTIK